MTLEDILFFFLEKNYDPLHPVLLALSGGADSLALFHLLDRYRSKSPLHFGIAHVDHGWRQESAGEAQQLQKLADNLGIPFHLKTLNCLEMTGNLEEACRQERLAFFSQLCQENGYQSVILGHHADDQSETVLKKILEGSSLPYLCGMASTSQYQKLTLWRPLLTCSKKQIKHWLEERGYIPFEDQTNFDEKFLRSRFRTKIIPELSKNFGKEVAQNLCRINDEAEELKAYLETQLESYIQSILAGPFGSCLDLAIQCPKHDFEIKYLLRKACEKEGIRLSYHLIHEICQKIRTKSPNCKFLSKGCWIYVDRGRVFIMKQPFIQFSDDIPLKEGCTSLGQWSVEVRATEHQKIVLSGWKEAWMGNMYVQMPSGKFSLRQGNSSLSKWWTNAKIPAFMRKAFPVVFSENGVEHEFLTKRRLTNRINSSQNQWLITIKYSELT